MCRPTLCLGPAVALAAAKAHATSCPLAPYVKLGMRDGVAVVPWSWIRLCVKVGKMPVGSARLIEPLPPTAFPCVPSESSRSRGFDDAWSDMHRLSDVLGLKKLLVDRKKMKKKLSRKLSAREKFTTDPAVVKTRTEFVRLKDRVETLERNLRLKGPSPVCRDPVPGDCEVFPPTKVGGVPDWPWHDEEGLSAKTFPPSNLWEFVAQVNLSQVHASCSLIPEGLLPESGVLYFFLDRDFDRDDEDMLADGLVRYYSLVDRPPLAGRARGLGIQGCVRPHRAQAFPKAWTHASQSGHLLFNRARTSSRRPHDASVDRGFRTLAAGMVGLAGDGFFS
jgi:hypothetical protein